MPLTRAGLEAARAQLHTDLDSYIEAATALTDGPAECSPVIFYHLATGLSWMTCAHHGATITAADMDRERRARYLGEPLWEDDQWL